MANRNDTMAIHVSRMVQKVAIYSYTAIWTSSLQYNVVILLVSFWNANTQNYYLGGHNIIILYITLCHAFTCIEHQKKIDLQKGTWYVLFIDVIKNHDDGCFGSHTMVISNLIFHHSTLSKSSSMGNDHLIAHLCTYIRTSVYNYVYNVHSNCS